MAFNTLVKQDYSENTYVVEQCHEGAFCKAITTFLEHAGTSTKLEFTRLLNLSTGEDKKRINLIHRLPANKGNFIVFKFCPFCGGSICESNYETMATSKKTGERKKIYFSYRPFSPEDYIKYDAS